MVIGNIQQCNLAPLSAISVFLSLSPHFQFNLQFRLLSSCLTITLCPQYASSLRFLMEMFHIWSASSPSSLTDVLSLFLSITE